MPGDFHSASRRPRHLGDHVTHVYAELQKAVVTKREVMWQVEMTLALADASASNLENERKGPVMDNSRIVDRVDGGS